MSLLEKAIRTVKRGLGLSSHSPLVAPVRPAYDFLLQQLYGYSGMQRRFHQERPIRLHPRYRSLAENAEQTVFAALKAHVRAGATVLDVGANVGVYSLLMARWVGPGGRVYAFEPAPESLQALRHHVTLNRLNERIEVVGCAVSDLAGKATFYAHSFNGANSLRAGFAREVPAARASLVRVTTLDAFCASRSLAPCLIKIDIEGYELHALQGARQTLRKHRPVLVVEMHPMNWPEIGRDREQAAALLARLGYRLLPLQEQSDPLAQYGHVLLEPMG